MIIEELPDQQIYFEIICKNAINKINERDNTTLFKFGDSYYCIWTIPDPIVRFKQPIEFIIARKIDISICKRLKELSPQILLDTIHELTLREVYEA